MIITMDTVQMPDNSCTIGKLTTESGFTCYTMENPWKNNEKNVSCIPAGWYKLTTRMSPIVERTSRGEFKMGWEVTDVVGRSFIMIHVGNWVKDTDGCPLVGRDISFSRQGFMVTHSVDTFRKFMAELESEAVHELRISRSGI